MSAGVHVGRMCCERCDFVVETDLGELGGVATFAAAQAAARSMYKHHRETGHVGFHFERIANGVRVDVSPVFDADGLPMPAGAGGGHD